MYKIILLPGTSNKILFWFFFAFIDCISDTKNEKCIFFDMIQVN